MEEISNFIINAYFEKIKVLRLPGPDYIKMNASNDHHPEILPMASKIIFTCAWDNHHELLYKKMNLRYTYNPCHTAEFFYDCMKEHKGTDITLVSKQNKSIATHSLFLCQKSQIFDSMYNGSFKERKQNTISLNYSTLAIERMLEFIYKGRITVSESQTLESLEELLLLSDYLGINDLFNYSIDLIDRLILGKTYKNNYELDSEMTITLLRLITQLNIKEFIIPCLVSAESLERQASTSKEHIFTFDWNELPSGKLSWLLIEATKLELPIIQEKIAKCLDDLSKQIDIQTLEINNLKKLTPRENNR